MAPTWKDISPEELARLESMSQKREKTDISPKICQMDEIISYGGNKAVFRLSLPPSTNGIYVNRPGGRYLKKEGKSWKWNTGWIIQSAGKYNMDASYKVEIVMHLARDRDIDGSLKLLLDSMSGIVYKDDRQVTEMNVKKIKSKDPHLILTISPL